jgi:hypothetical protein
MYSKRLAVMGSLAAIRSMGGGRLAVMGSLAGGRLVLSRILASSGSLALSGRLAASGRLAVSGKLGLIGSWTACGRLPASVRQSHTNEPAQNGLYVHEHALKSVELSRNSVGGNMLEVFLYVNDISVNS